MLTDPPCCGIDVHLDLDDHLAHQPDQLDLLLTAIPWRTALAVRAAFDQLNAARPGRSKRSDGTIGDAAHASRSSDHNPWVDDPASALNVVTAGDLTDDPASGLDWTVDDARAFLADPRAKYAIVDDWFVDRDAAGRIRVRRYLDVNPARTNPHRGHLHLSVQSAKHLYDDARPWAAIAAKLGAPAPTPAPAPAPTGLFVDGVLGPATIRRWQQVMGTPVDGVISPRDSALVFAVQRRLYAAPGTGIYLRHVDGELGPITIRGLQRYLGTPVDGVISRPRSSMVAALQERLNRGVF